MGILQIGSSEFQGKANASPPCLDLGDGTSVLLTTAISDVEPRGTNIEFRKGSKSYYLTNKRTTIADIFPDPLLAEHIASQISKSLTETIVLEDLDKVTYLGASGSGAVTSFFTGKNVTTWEGTQHLKKLRRVLIRGALGNAKEIDLSNATEITSLFYAFRDVSGLEKIYFPETMDVLTDADYAFYAATNLTYIKMPVSAASLEKINFAFNGTKLTEIILPEKLDNLKSMGNTFYNALSLRNVYLPAKLPALTTSLNSTALDMQVKRNIIYHADDSVTRKSQIKFHDASGNPTFTSAVPDYGNLVNLE